MNATEFTALLVLSTAMSFTPGPNTTLSTALAANQGLKRALPFVCSVPVGFGSLLRDWLAGPAQTGARLRWFNRAMAAVLVLTAGWMLTV